MRAIPTVVPALLLGLAAACAPATPAAGPAPAGLPPVPRVQGPLSIRVVHPTADTPKPGVDSTFVFGSVGSGSAELSINGTPVEVAPNGAFLAYLRVPEDGRYELVATSGAQTERASVGYRMPDPAAPRPAPAARVTTQEFVRPVVAIVVDAADTLRTGSDVAVGRPTPGGTYRWYLPAGARVPVTARRGDALHVRLDGATSAWFPAASLALADSPVVALPVDSTARGDTARAAMPQPDTVPAPPGPVAVNRAARWVDVRLPVRYAPFLVEPDSAAPRLAVTLYGVSLPPVPVAGEGISGTWTSPAAGTARLELVLAEPLWGYKAWYDAEGALVLRLRRPPVPDSAQPLRGIRVAVDPGHPPAGATGPTGLWEPVANLAIGKEVVRALRARGADVLMLRSGEHPVSLGDRTQMAAAWDADVLVSLHNNAFPEGVNPFRSNHTATYYYQPFAAPLARALQAALVGVTQIRDGGARSGNLALARPTWMPSALTESLFMMVPQQEAALREPRFLRRLGEAHAQGVEDFLRGLLPAPAAPATGAAR